MSNIVKPPDIEQRGEHRQGIFAELDAVGKKIAVEYGIEPDQIEVNTTPTASTWVVNFYIKDEAELRKLLSFMKENDMLEGFE